MNQFMEQGSNAMDKVDQLGGPGGLVDIDGM